jgi:ribonuclease BN (tRNA processing enzyme)
MGSDLSPIRLIPLGVGHSFTTLFHYTNFLLLAGTRRIYIDCPPYLLKMLRHYREALNDPEICIERYQEVIVTHTHEDHCAGIEELGYMSIRGRPYKPRIYAPSGVHSSLWAESLAAGLRWRMDGDAFVSKEYTDYFTPVYLEYGKPFDMGEGIVLEIRRVKHMPETFGLKLAFGPGRSLGYSADTGFMPELFDWWADCGVILHEVHFDPDIRWHTPLRDLLSLPEAVQERIWLCHYTDDYQDHDIGAMRYLEQGVPYTLFTAGS